MDDLTPSNIANAPVTRKSANKISKHLIDPNDDRFSEALGIAHRWRRQHALPTEECFRSLLGATEAIGAPSLSFRLKRMESIIGKIKRPGKHYQLGTMDDIGGCRVIVDDMPQLEEAVWAIRSTLRLKEGDGAMKDYTRRPRESGYRSCHLVTMNRGDDRDYRVEVQVRTKLQHLWATAIEAVGSVYGIDLKTEKAPEEYCDPLEGDLRALFASLADVLAIEEGCPPSMPGTTMEAALAKTRGSAILGRVLSDLSNVKDGVFVEGPSTDSDSPGLYLMEFRRGIQYLSISRYNRDGIDDAFEKYDRSDVEARLPFTEDDREESDTVLAYARSEEELALVYPNYSAKVEPLLQELGKRL